MGSAGAARLVWPGMVLSGLLLAGLVWAAWPEPTVRLIPLPDGESMPKTVAVPAPAAAGRPAPREVKATASPTPSPTPAAPAAAPVAEEEPARVLAAVEPEPSTHFGPAPLPSELELAGDYVRESPEELGAKPLPGVVVTPEPPPVAG